MHGELDRRKEKSNIFLTSNVFQLTAEANTGNRAQRDYGVLPDCSSEVFSRCAKQDFYCHKQ